MSSTRAGKKGVDRDMRVKVKGQVSSSAPDINASSGSTTKRKGTQKGKDNAKRPKKNESLEKASTSSEWSLVVSSRNEQSQQRHIYQFNVALSHLEPKVWKMVELEDGGTFHDLHLAIERTFGRRDWLPHLYEFRMENNPEKMSETRRLENSSTRGQIHQAFEEGRKAVTYIGGTSYPFGLEIDEFRDIYDGEQRIAGREAILKDFFILNVSRCMYTYDLGDSLGAHKVVLEKILPAQEGQTYPKCLK